MAAKKTTFELTKQYELGNGGILLHVWDGLEKGLRLEIGKARLKLYRANAKKPTWEGTWEEFVAKLQS